MLVCTHPRRIRAGPGCDTPSRGGRDLLLLGSGDLVIHHRGGGGYSGGGEVRMWDQVRRRGHPRTSEGERARRGRRGRR